MKEGTNHWVEIPSFINHGTTLGNELQSALLVVFFLVTVVNNTSLYMSVLMDGLLMSYSVQTTNGENGHVSLVLVLNLLVGIEFTTNLDDSGSLLLLVLANQGRVRRTTASRESLFS